MNNHSLTSENSVKLRSQLVDKVASLLVAVLIVLLSAVVIMFAIWMATRWNSELPDQITSSTAYGNNGLANDFTKGIQFPDAEEVALLSESPLDASLDAVTQAATEVAASQWTSADSNANSSSGTFIAGGNDRYGQGMLGDGDGTIPRYERWVLKFVAKDLKTYASQLDYFQIELGCIGGSRLVDYAKGFSEIPQRRTGKGSEEKRLYFMWRNEGPLTTFDRQLLLQAGIDSEGRQLLKFIPKEVEAQLAAEEMRFLRSNESKRLKDVSKTIFEFRMEGNRYYIAVIDQLYR